MKQHGGYNKLTPLCIEQVAQYLEKPLNEAACSLQRSPSKFKQEIKDLQISR